MLLSKLNLFLFVIFNTLKPLSFTKTGSNFFYYTIYVRMAVLVRGKV